MSYSTAFADAIVSSMTASFDPMNGAIRQMVGAQAQQAELELDVRREAFLDSIRSKLQAAKDNGEDAAVVDAYRRLYDKHSGKR